MSHQLGGQGIGPGRDRAGAKADDHVAGLGLFAHQAREVGLVDQGAGVAVAVGDQARDQIVAGGAGDRVFARRIDIGDGDDVGLVEAGAEFLEQVATGGYSGAAGARR